MQVTHYQTLGIWPDATLEEIKAAYRERMRRNHPDLSGASSCTAAELNTAYRQLCTEDRRRAYDLELKAAAAAKRAPVAVTEQDVATAAPTSPAAAPEPLTVPAPTARACPPQVRWSEDRYREWRKLLLMAVGCMMMFTAMAIWCMLAPSPRQQHSMLEVVSPSFLALAWLIAMLERNHWFLWLPMIAICAVGVASVPTASPLHFLSPAVPIDLLIAVIGTAISAWLVRASSPHFFALRAVRPRFCAYPPHLSK